MSEWPSPAPVTPEVIRQPLWLGIRSILFLGSIAFGAMAVVAVAAGANPNANMFDSFSDRRVLLAWLVTGTPVVALTLFLLWRRLRIALVLDGTGVTIRNMWRQHQVAWRDIEQLRVVLSEYDDPSAMPGGIPLGGIKASPILKVITRGSKQFDADATFFRSASRFAPVAAIMNTWATRFGVALTTESTTLADLYGIKVAPQ